MGQVDVEFWKISQMQTKISWNKNLTLVPAVSGLFGQSAQS